MFKNTQGVSNTIILDEDCPINMAIIIYASESKTQNVYNRIINGRIAFLFGATLLRINDETPIKLIFKNTYYPKVVVNPSDNLIG